MKRIFSLLLALLLVAALLCSCSGGAKTTLYLLNWGEYLDPDLITEFEDQNPDIKVKNDDDYHQRRDVHRLRDGGNENRYRHPL